MPKIYARINNTAVVELILPAFYDAEHPDRVEGEPSRVGMEIPIQERFTSEIVTTLVDITDVIPEPQLNWVYTGGKFSAPEIPTIDPSVAAIARMAAIDTASVRFLRKVAIGNITEVELDVLESLDEEYSLLADSL